MMKFIAPIIAVAIALAVFFGYIDPSYDDIKEVGREVAQYDEALAKSRELESVRDDLLITYNGFEEGQLDRLRKLLPDNVDNVRLILDIDSVASKFGLVLRNVSISEVSKEVNVGSLSEPDGLEDGFDSVSSIDVSFSVASSYENFLTFLKELEQSLRLVEVTSLSFEASEIDLYEFKISLKTYWLK